MVGIDAKLDKIEKLIRELGVSHYCLIAQDPDSDEYGGRTGDRVWSIGAMLLYSEHLKERSKHDEQET